MAALSRLGGTEVGPFLLGVMEDERFSSRIRQAAAIEAGRTKAEAVEKRLLAILDTESTSPELAARALQGLLLMAAEEYASRLFQEIQDPSGHMTYRELLASGTNMGKFLSDDAYRQMLLSRRRQLDECLEALKGDGTPADKVRIEIWLTVNLLFNDEPSIILTEEGFKDAGCIRRAIEARMVAGETRYKSYAALREAAENKFLKLVKVHAD